MEINPTVLAILISVASAILGAAGVDLYVHCKNKTKKAIEKHKKERQEELKEALTPCIEEAIKPVSDKIDDITAEIEEIKSDLSDNTVGTVTILRDRMKAILDECRAAGYASTSTVANGHELYNTYKSLGGNHFREYVDAWKQELESLPTTTPIKDRKGSKATVKADLKDK